jgi:alpha-L-fucosidase 2
MPNLWDSHPPFQIDGNFGGTAGIAEMLIQSHEGYIHLLPALPDEWRNGHFEGLTARGGFAVSAAWENGEVREIKAVSSVDGKLKIFVNDTFVECDTAKGEEMKLVKTEDGFVKA